jgi:hypothetical protein
MRIVPLALTALVGAAASGDVVIQMPAAPAVVVPVVSGSASSTGAQGQSVSPLQRFAIGEPAKDRAGNVILAFVPSSVNVGGGGYGGYGWGGYGWGGYGWSSWGWGYPFMMPSCCNPCDTPWTSGWRGTSMSFGR